MRMNKHKSNDNYNDYYYTEKNNSKYYITKCNIMAVTTTAEE